MALPSIRECMQRLDAVGSDVQRSVTALETLNAELWPGEPASELLDGVACLRTVHQLAKDLAANLRNFGTPPEQPPSVKQRAQSLHVGTPAHLARAAGLKPMPHSWNGVQAEQRSHEAASLARTGRQAPQIPTRRRSPDHLDSQQLATLLCTTRARICLLSNTRGLPAPVAKEGRKLLWSKVAVLAWKAAQDAAASMPDGWLTTTQVCTLVGHHASWLWSAVKEGRFPDAPKKHGAQKIWPVEMVNQWIRERAAAAAMPKPEPVIPSGFMTTKQVLAEVGRTDVWLYHAMKNLGFPRPESKLGHKSLWRRSAVAAWLKAPPPSAGTHNTRKPFGPPRRHAQDSTR